MISEDRTTILVADDQSAVRAALRAHLENNGFRVLTAANAC
mgnify:CR=1 FL=1